MGMDALEVLCPFAVSVEPMAAMLNVEIDDDPTYSGLEIQRFDDPVHGTGLAVLLMRRNDRRVDVYREPGLRLDPAAYAIGAGVGHWCEADLDPAVLEVSAGGVLASVSLRDAEQRRIDVHIDDRDGRQRQPATLLAPVSASAEEPTSMLLVWMPVFDLVRRTGPGASITIEGRAVTTGRLPLAWLHRRRLIKYAADLLVIRLNPAQDGPVDVRDSHLGQGIAEVTARRGEHDVRLIIDPVLPDLQALVDGAVAEGTWRVDIDTTLSVVGGSWSARRTATRVDLVMDSTQRWRPGPLPLLMRVVTRIVPTFRRWPTTYRWSAEVTLGSTPVMRSAWQRTGPVR